jgi:hypothetical protein
MGINLLRIKEWLRRGSRGPFLQLAAGCYKTIYPMPGDAFFSGIKDPI